MHRLSLILLFSAGLMSQDQTVGLFYNSDEAFPGYTLFTPVSYSTTYLINNEGEWVHQWESEYLLGLSAYLLDNGSLLRTRNLQTQYFNTGGTGGGIESLNWDGSIQWEFEYSTEQFRQHHDIERLPNGNILIIAWEHKSVDDAIDAGRNPSLLGDTRLPVGIWPESIIEVNPNTDEVEWEWHVWDHLIQEYDSSKANFGSVSEHPERVNINYPANGPAGDGGDWMHINAINYNSNLDQILLSVSQLNEIWIIDHSTTTEEASSHTGGNSGMGGDIIFRWGNPNAYDRGSPQDRQIYFIHDAHWISDSLENAGKIMFFNNGQNRPEGNYSSIDIISPPLNESFTYDLVDGNPYGPDSLFWSYTSNPPQSFFARNVSGAQRLSNGNTLICSGPNGRFFEINPENEIV